MSQIAKLAAGLVISLESYLKSPIHFYMNTDTTEEKKQLVRTFLYSVIQVANLQQFDLPLLLSFFNELDHFFRENKRLQQLISKEECAGRIGKILKNITPAVCHIRSDINVYIYDQFKRFDNQMNWLKSKLIEEDLFLAKVNFEHIERYTLFYTGYQRMLLNIDPEFVHEMQGQLHSICLPHDRVNSLRQRLWDLQTQRMHFDWLVNGHQFAVGSEVEMLIQRHRIRELRDELLFAEKNFIKDHLVQVCDDIKRSSPQDTITKEQLENFRIWLNGLIDYLGTTRYSLIGTNEIRWCIQSQEEIMQAGGQTVSAAEVIQDVSRIIQQKKPTFALDKINSYTGTEKVGSRKTRCQEAWLDYLLNMVTVSLTNSERHMFDVAMQIVATANHTNEKCTFSKYQKVS